MFIDRQEEQFNYDETLLNEGKYGEWFYQGLQPKHLAYLNTPAKVLEPPAQEPIYKNQEFPQVKDWRDKAACAGADPVVFFGEEGADLRRQYMNPNAKWRQYCPQCPVRELCLELARNSESVGIFGGKFFTYANNYTGSREYTEETMPRKGRPPKRKLPMNMSAAEREKTWNEMQEEINARISAA